MGTLESIFVKNIKSGQYLYWTVTDLAWKNITSSEILRRQRKLKLEKINALQPIIRKIN